MVPDVVQIDYPDWVREVIAWERGYPTDEARMRLATVERFLAFQQLLGATSHVFFSGVRIGCAPLRTGISTLTVG